MFFCCCGISNDRKNFDILVLELGSFAISFCLSSTELELSLHKFDRIFTQFILISKVSKRLISMIDNLRVK